MACNYWKESVSELLDDLGINLDDSKRNELVDGIEHIRDMEYEATGHEHIANPRNADLEIAQKKIAKLEADVEKANTNFRKNVAMRRNCREEDVELEDDGYAYIRR